MYEDERLKNLDPKMIELIKNEIMDNGNPITWDDIAGLQFAKTTIQVCENCLKMNFFYFKLIGMVFA